MQFHVYSTMEWIALLAEPIIGTGRSAFYSEGIVFRIGEVASPKVDGEPFVVDAGMGTEQGIHLL